VSSLATDVAAMEDASLHDAALLSDQVHTQAAQLADHLQRQRKGLDRRESELNACVASLESELRSSRLTAFDREQSLQEKEAQVAAQQQQLDAKQVQRQEAEQQHERELSFATKHCDALAQKCKHYEAKLDQERLALAALQIECDKLRASQIQSRHTSGEQLKQERDEFEIHRRATLQRLATMETELDVERHKQRQREEEARQLGERERQLADAQGRLSNREAELDHQHGELKNRQATSAQQLREQQEEISRRREQLLTRSSVLDQREATVEQLQAEVTQIHRESLEMRVISEELWARLASQKPAAEATAMLAELRTKLTDQYRLAEASLVHRREELNELVIRLDRQQRDLQSRSDELRQWADARQTEFQHQAQQLAQQRQ